MPTIRQERAFKEIVEKGRTSVSAVMRDVGYSKKTAVDPSKLTDSNGWKELMAKYLPDEKLAQVHSEGLEATNIDGDIDYRTRHLYLDTAYKLKGSYAPDKLLTASLSEILLAIKGGDEKKGQVEPFTKDGI